jgi:hypothetical protein
VRYGRVACSGRLAPDGDPLTLRYMEYTVRAPWPGLGAVARPAAFPTADCFANCAVGGASLAGETDRRLSAPPAAGGVGADDWAGGRGPAPAAHPLHRHRAGRLV